MKVGEVVFTTCGRDKGIPFIVTKVDKNFAWLCNGKLRKTVAPKKKNLKHLKSTDLFDENIASKIKNGELILDAEYKKSAAIRAASNL